MASTAPAESSKRRGGKGLDEARVPGSAASLKVKENDGSVGAALVASGSVAPTDVQLLTSSILSNQTRQAVTLRWQERLIGLGSLRPVTLEELKRALTYLGPSSWLQVLHERYLAGTCPYPPCENDAPVSKQMGKYRISLARKEVYRNTTERPGDRDTFCSDRCFARAQWVRTWVLKDADDDEDTPRQRVGKDAPPEGGRWERMMDESRWNELELLEDLEHNPDYADVLGALSIQPSFSSSKPVAVSQEKLSKQFDDTLVIRERTPGAPQPNAAPWSQDVPSEPLDTAALNRLDIRSALGTSAKITKPEQPTKAESEDEEDDEKDMDPKALLERRETLRLMDEAMRARDEQRTLGLLE